MGLPPALHLPAQRNPNRKVLTVPRACIKQQFGAREPAAATLPTDWGVASRIDGRAIREYARHSFFGVE